MVALYTLIGCLVGSFLNVVCDRVPAGGSLWGPPSHCPNCGRRLAAWELIPVFSYVLLGGRCSSCGARIPLRILAVELATGLLFAGAWLIYGPTVRMLLITVSACVLLILFVIDLEHQIVPTRIIGPAILFAVATIPLSAFLGPTPFAHYALLSLIPLPGGVTWPLSTLAMLSQLLGGVLAFGIFWLIWKITPQGMGYGDVRLAAFAGLVTALPLALGAVLASFVLGGVIGALLLVSHLVGRKTAIPFAPFLVVTTMIALFCGDPMVAWYLFR